MNRARSFIILTRPEGRSDSLIAKLAENNYSAINIPCLGIKYVESAFNFLSDYTNSTKLIFVSVNAVEGFFKLYQTPTQSNQLIEKLNKCSVFAIGASTANKLKSFGIARVIYPPESIQENSEDFIKLSQLQDVAQDHIVLVRGDTSREFITANLSKKCASFTEVIVYNTYCPQGLITRDLIKANNDNYINNHIVLLTSGNILDNFYKKLSDDLKTVMLDAKIIVPSTRVATKAKDIGFKNIYCSNSMNEQTILDMIKTINI